MSRYTDTSISRWKGIRNEWLKPRTHIHQLSSEDVFEIVKQPKVTEDDKLVPTGLAVLQLSKLLLLRFIYFIEEHLIEKSYKILYLGKISLLFFTFLKYSIKIILRYGFHLSKPHKYWRISRRFWGWFQRYVGSRLQKYRQDGEEGFLDFKISRVVRPWSRGRYETKAW